MPRRFARCSRPIAKGNTHEQEDEDGKAGQGESNTQGAGQADGLVRRRRALAGSNIRILDVRTDDVDDVRAKANAADTLVRYPDVKGLVGLWSYNGPAIVNALRESGKAGQIKAVVFDEEQETLSGSIVQFLKTEAERTQVRQAFGRRVFDALLPLAARTPVFTPAPLPML